MLFLLYFWPSKCRLVSIRAFSTPNLWMVVYVFILITFFIIIFSKYLCIDTLITKFTQIALLISLFPLCPDLFSEVVFSSFQLVDVTTAFQGTQIEFIKDALLKPGGCIQAICVPEGTVRTESVDSDSYVPTPQLNLQHRQCSQISKWMNLFSQFLLVI